MGRVAQPLRRPDWSKLDRRQPFNKDWPGWAGCQLALMPFPHLRGGPTWVDPWHKIDGVLTNMDPATDWVATEYGSALDFDGTNDRVVIPASAELNPTSQICVECDVLLRPGIAGNANYFSKPTADGSVVAPFAQWTLKGNAGNGLVPEFQVNISGTVSFATSASALSADRWYSLAGTYDGATIRLYVDGVQVASTARTGAMTTYNTSVYIGMWGGGVSQFLAGRVGRAAIYHVAADVDAVYDRAMQARIGFPDALRWLRGRSMVSVPAGGGGITGTSATTEASDTVSAAGAMPIVGAVATTEADDTVAAAAASLISGTSATSEANDTVAAAGAVVIAASSSTTEDPDAITAAGTVAIVGTLATTEDDDTVFASSATESTGSGATTEDPDTIACAGAVLIAAQSTTVEADDSISATATLVISGQSATSDGSDTVSAAGGVVIAGSSSITDASDSVSGSGVVPIVATSSTTEADDLVSASGRNGSIEYWRPLRSRFLRSSLLRGSRL